MSNCHWNSNFLKNFLFSERLPYRWKSTRHIQILGFTHEILGFAHNNQWKLNKTTAKPQLPWLLKTFYGFLKPWSQKCLNSTKPRFSKTYGFPMVFENHGQNPWFSICLKIQPQVFSKSPGLNQVPKRWNCIFFKS